MNASSSDSPLDSPHPVANLPIPTGDRREAFFGLIAPIGVDLDAVTLALTRSLSNIGYNTNEIRLTDIFRKYPHWYDVKYKTEELKYKKYIRAGDDLRKDTGRDDRFIFNCASAGYA